MVSEEITPDPPSHPTVETILNQRPRAEVDLECGCKHLTDSEHASGSRMVVCRHGYEYVVWPEETVIYKARRIQ